MKIKPNFLYILLFAFIVSITKSKNGHKGIDVSLISPPGMIPGLTISTSCDLEKLNFSWRPQTAYSDFFMQIKNFMTGLSAYELKDIYKFLDGKTLGYFTNTRWNNFYSLFLEPFNKCDEDKDCMLDPEELKTCLEGEDMDVVMTYMSEGFDEESLVSEILFSLGGPIREGINLGKYLLLKRIVIGFRQFHVSGLLDKETFFSAIKTTFVDKLIDELDSEIIYRISLSLMIEQVKSFQLNFIQYFESCRLVNSFLSFGVSIGEGYITKDQMLKNFESDRYPTKLNILMLEKYFSLYKEDTAHFNTDMTNYDPNTMRFEDHSTLEFWANVFSNYTDPHVSTPSLNVTGFKNLFQTNKYMRKKYWIYLAYSNFENYTQMNVTPPSANITDYDFLTNFGANFLETYVQLGFKMKKSKMLVGHKNNLRSNKITSKSESQATFLKTSVFERMNIEKYSSKFSTKSHSLFELKLTDEDDSSGEEGSKEKTDLVPLMDSSLDNYFNILDFNQNELLTFGEFIIFLKYMRIYDRFNKQNDDRRGLLNSNCVNFINQYNIYPKLSLAEKIRVQNLDSLNCETVDFLLFLDYMIGPTIFSPFVSDVNKGFVHEVDVLVTMKKMNLYADVNQRTFLYRAGTLQNSYDYESILSIGYKNKCTSNLKLFKWTKNVTEEGNYSQQLNSTLVDPESVPDLEKEEENEDNDSTDTNSTDEDNNSTDTNSTDEDNNKTDTNSTDEDNNSTDSNSTDSDNKKTKSKKKDEDNNKTRSKKKDEDEDEKDSASPDDDKPHKKKKRHKKNKHKKKKEPKKDKDSDDPSKESDPDDSEASIKEDKILPEEPEINFNDGDDVRLDKAAFRGAGMDTSKEINDSFN